MNDKKRFRILGAAFVWLIFVWAGLLLPWLGFLRSHDQAADIRAAVLTREEYQQLADPRVRMVYYNHGKSALLKSEDPNWEQRQLHRFQPILNGTYYIDSRAYARLHNREYFSRLFTATFPAATISLICLVIYLRGERKQTFRAQSDA